MISDAFEEVQKQNQRLLQQMTERDEVSNQLVTERIKSGHAAAAHKQEQAAAAAARLRAEQNAAMLQERVNDLHTKLQVRKGCLYKPWAMLSSYIACKGRAKASDICCSIHSFTYAWTL